MNESTRISAVDLRELSDEEMGALSREAMRRGISIQQLYGQLIAQVAQNILSKTGDSDGYKKSVPGKKRDDSSSE